MSFLKSVSVLVCSDLNEFAFPTKVIFVFYEVAASSDYVLRWLQDSEFFYWPIKDTNNAKPKINIMKTWVWIEQCNTHENSIAQKPLEIPM